MAKKVKIAITIDEDILSLVDEEVRERQREQLMKAEKVIVSRSGVIEGFVREFFKRKKSLRIP